MNVDTILRTFNRHGVAYLLIGGMNFFLRHKPVLTYDVDFWIDDTTENMRRCETALTELDAEWGASKEDWNPVRDRKSGWLSTQALFCLTSPHGAIDIFRSMKGLKNWSACNDRAFAGSTSAGVSYRGLSDEDMLRAEYALDEKDRKADRIHVLEEAVRSKEH